MGPPGCSWMNWDGGGRSLFFNTRKTSTAACGDGYPNAMCLCVDPCSSPSPSSASLPTSPSPSKEDQPSSVVDTPSPSTSSNTGTSNSPSSSTQNSVVAGSPSPSTSSNTENSNSPSSSTQNSVVAGTPSPPSTSNTAPSPTTSPSSAEPSQSLPETSRTTTDTTTPSSNNNNNEDVNNDAINTKDENDADGTSDTSNTTRLLSNFLPYIIGAIGMCLFCCVIMSIYYLCNNFTIERKTNKLNSINSRSDRLHLIMEKKNNHQRGKTWESIDMNGVELVGNPLGIIPPAPAFPPPPPPRNVCIGISN